MGGWRFSHILGWIHHQPPLIRTHRLVLDLRDIIYDTGLFHKLAWAGTFNLQYSSWKPAKCAAVTRLESAKQEDKLCLLLHDNEHIAFGQLCRDNLPLGLLQQFRGCHLHSYQDCWWKYFVFCSRWDELWLCYWIDYYHYKRNQNHVSFHSEWHPCQYWDRFLAPGCDQPR